MNDNQFLHIRNEPRGVVFELAEYDQNGRKSQQSIQLVSRHSLEGMRFVKIQLGALIELLGLMLRPIAPDFFTAAETLALDNVFRPLAERYKRGERSPELFCEMMEVE